jgi:hypothetical protein
VISGEAMKQAVAGLPSFLAGKFRLNDVTIELTSSALNPSRFHWPMHGPQELVRSVAPIASSSAI